MIFREGAQLQPGIANIQEFDSANLPCFQFCNHCNAMGVAAINFPNIAIWFISAASFDFYITVALQQLTSSALSTSLYKSSPCVLSRQHDTTCHDTTCHDTTCQHDTNSPLCNYALCNFDLQDKKGTDGSIELKLCWHTWSVDHLKWQWNVNNLSKLTMREF